jgi:hypothetical protein
MFLAFDHKGDIGRKINKKTRKLKEKPHKKSQIDTKRSIFVRKKHQYVAKSIVTLIVLTRLNFDG